MPTDIDHVLTTSLPQPGLPMASLNGKPYAWGSWGSPVAKAEYGGDKTMSISRIDISETLNYEITDWQTANANIGYNTYSKTLDEVKNSIQYYNITGEKVVLTDPTQAKSYYRQMNERADNYTLTGYLNGHKDFGKHGTSLTAGVQYEFKDFKRFGATAENILEGIEIINGTGDIKLYDLSLIHI